jgi:hypothetical protein
MLTQTKKIIRDLGNGLILRHGSPEDANALCAFNARIHGDDEEDGKRVAAWTRDLLTRPHPTLKPEDFTIVEETATGKIVSSLNLIPQTWTYEGIEFGVGRPELVGSDSNYRGKGLVRIQFDEVHRWCNERGFMVQGITGILYFYRQFGYEYALDLGGRRFGFNVPKLKDDAVEKFRFRPAEEKDIPFLLDVYAYGRKRSMISSKWTEEICRYQLSGRSRESIYFGEHRVIERIETGEPVGYLVYPPRFGMTGINIYEYELQPGVSWLEVTPAVVRYLWETGQEIAKLENRRCTTFGFVLGAQHPSYEVMGDGLPNVVNPYAWYLRVPDLIGFLNHIKPALEKRLTESVVCGHSGEFLIGMYPKGIKLTLERGCITGIEPWKPDHAEHGNAGFPALTFLQILFGYRSFEELKYAFPDCWWDNNGTRTVIKALFPKKHSGVLGVA